MSYRTSYKKFLSFILAVLIACCFCGCGRKGAETETNSKTVQNGESTKSSSDSSKENTESSKAAATTEKEDVYAVYGNDEQNLIVYKDTDFGSFEKPHKIGESVRLRHSDVNIGKTDLIKTNIYDYDVTFEQVLTGKEAEQKLKESCSNFDEEKYLFEDNDVYLIKVHIKYNPESKIKDRLPVDINVAAVNSQGKYVSVEHRFDDSQYSNKTVNGEVTNRYPVFVPKGADIKLVFVIGSPMEYPGPVAAVYYDK